MDNTFEKIMEAISSKSFKPYRKINSQDDKIIWAIDAALISPKFFSIEKTIFNPYLDMLCMGGDFLSPSTYWGFWSIKKEDFEKNYKAI